VSASRREKQGSTSSAVWALVIHGGAGSASDDGLDAARQRTTADVLAAVLGDGADALRAGASSLDVVEQAVRVLEDSPLFNAGRGAVFNARGEHELEASIMNGRTLAAGAVAAVQGIANPVTLARWVMERTPHVFLQGEGAMTFAQSQGMPIEPPDYFYSEHRYKAWEAARRGADRSEEHGTVGAVALDLAGDLAAATSTGGLTNKPPGRIADSSVIGAGTYASNASCAVSCTGHGEYFLRATVARDIAALVEYGGQDAAAAARQIIDGRLTSLGGRGGVIVVDRFARVAWTFNTELMYRGAVTARSAPQVAVFAESSAGR
jgi:L-asparaginase / beta-aspartyl-peptidase